MNYLGPRPPEIFDTTLADRHAVITEGDTSV